MGDGSRESPDWLDREQGTFRLYAYAEPNEARATFRLDALTADQREHLWRQRALIHAVIRRWDAAKHWSQQPAWRRLNGWILPFERLFDVSEHALNLSAWAYSRARGQESAALDFATFAEEALAPADGVPEEDQVRCQEFSKSRVLRELGILEAPRGRCEVFDRWADLSTLEGVEVVFVAASGRAPESLFGHLMMRIQRHSGERVIGPGLLPAVQLVALTGGDLPGPKYIVRGLFGGYPMVVMTAPMLDVQRQMLEFEQRSMRRYRLRLSAAESERMLERIWELERRGRLDYRFLQDNCAFAAAFAINGALEDGREILLPSRLSPLLPAAVLDAISAVKASDGHPLLEQIPGALLATRDLARSAAEERTVELASLRRADPSLPWSDAAGADPARRLAAYQAVARASPRLVESDRDALFGFLEHSVQLERSVFDVAEGKALKARLAALTSPPKAPAGEDEASSREHLFERESDLANMQAILDRPQRMQDGLMQLPHRPFNEDEAELIRSADRAEQRLHTLLDLQARTVEQVAAGVDPVAWLARQQQRIAEAETSLARRSLRDSGYARTAAAAGMLATARGWTPVLTLTSSAFSEELGDHRIHGLDPAAELTLLGGEAQLVASDRGPRFLRSDFTAVAYRNVRREPLALRTTPLDWLGWGFSGGWSYAEGRPFTQRAVLSGEALAILDDTPDLSRLSALGVGLHGALGLEETTPELLAGPRLSFVHRRHLGGGYANCLKLSAEYQPAWLLLTHQLTHELRAKAQLDLQVRSGILSVVATLDAAAADKQARNFTPGLAIQFEPGVR